MGTKKFFIYAPIWLQIILLGPQRPKDSKYVLRFEIGRREGDEKIGRTFMVMFGQTDRGSNFTIYYIDVLYLTCFSLLGYTRKLFKKYAGCSLDKKF